MQKEKVGRIDQKSYCKLMQRYTYYNLAKENPISIANTFSQRREDFFFFKDKTK